MKTTQTAADLAREKLDAMLTAGVIAPGDKLPAERPLTEQLGVNRMSLRQALLSLENDGKIFRKNRSGWFAALPVFNYNPKSLASFNQAAKAQGRVPSWEYTDKLTVTDAPAEITGKFGLAAGDAVYLITGWGHWTGIKCSGTRPILTWLPVRTLPQNWITTLSRQSGKKNTISPPRLPDWHSNRPGCRKPPVRLSAVQRIPRHPGGKIPL